MKRFYFPLPHDYYCKPHQIVRLASSSPSLLLSSFRFVSSVDPLSRSGGAATVASRSATAVRASLPKFGRKRQSEAQQPGKSEFSALTLLDDPQQQNQQSNEDRELERAMEEAAWGDVNGARYGFATKPKFHPSFRTFLAELRRFDIRWSLLSPARAVMMMDVVRTGREDGEGETSLLRYVSDTEDTSDGPGQHALSDMLLWTKATLEDLHHSGAAAARRSHKMIPFMLPKPRSSSSSSSGGASDADEVALAARIRAAGCSNSRTDVQQNDDADRSIRDPRLASSSGPGMLEMPGMQFLSLECKMHPEIKASELYNAKSRPSLYQWATVSLSEASNKPNNSSKEPLIHVSLQTWTYLMVQSMIGFLTRNDIGVTTYELVSTLHAVKELQPWWHDVRRLAGMHEAEWPIDLQLLSFPGKKPPGGRR